MNFKEALIAHLQGEKVEVRLQSGWSPFMRIYGDTSLQYVDRDDAGEGDEYRIAPRTITVNGVEVPAPESVAPENGLYFFVPDFETDGMFIADIWSGTNIDNRFLRRGLVYLNKEDAIARAKAMLLHE